MAWRGGFAHAARLLAPAPVISWFARGADDAAAVAPADAKVSVGGKGPREYSYAADAVAASPPSLTEGFVRGGGFFV